MLKIELTNEQAVIYRFVMENYERIQYLEKKGIFKHRNGSIKINYKPDGQIQNVECLTIDYEK